MEKSYYEYRGCKDLVIAKVLSDTADGITYGPIQSFSGLREIGKTVEQNTSTSYYDDKAVIVYNTVGADTLTLTLSALSLEALATVTGQKYLDGALIEGDRQIEYWALGYKTSEEGTGPNGSNQDIYVWRFKGTFSIPDVINTTKTADASGANQQLTYTGVYTNCLFAENDNKSAKSTNICVQDGIYDASQFFDEVRTPDKLDDIRIKAATPTSYPAPGAISSGNTIYLVTATEGASIYYTLDGSTPTTSSTAYTNGITLTETTTIKAIATKQGLTDSNVASFEFTVS